MTGAAPLLDTLRRIAGAGHVLVDADARVGYEREWTGGWGGPALAVVRPGAVGEVAAVLGACAAAGASVVTQGGNSGLVGGGVPRAKPPGGRHQIVLSTARLDRILGVDPATAVLQAQTGVTLAAAQRAAAAAGLDLPLDLAARDSATLGGLAACDAGGLRALRHGTARRQIVGVEAVLADGSILPGRRLVKDTAGLDLGALLVGSEGTLGVITAVRWGLIGRRDARAVALVGLDTVAEAVALARALRPALPALEVCELMQRTGMALTREQLGVPAPLGDDPPVALLLECAAPDGDPLTALATALHDAGSLAGDRVAVAADARGRERLFAIRERHADALAATGIPVKFDVGLPLDGLAEFCDRVDGVVARVDPAARTIVFGHLLDGNLHVNVLPSGPSAGTGPEALEAAVLGLVAACDGTVSAEHGIGVQKPAHLGLTRTTAELAAMVAIKHALDPDDILNPGVGLPIGRPAHASPGEDRPIG